MLAVFSHFASCLGMVFGVAVPPWVIAAAAPYLAGLLTRETLSLGAWAIKKLRADPKTAPLAEGVVALEDMATAAVGAAAGSYAQGPEKMAQAAGKAAEGALLKDAPSLAAAAEAEITALAGEKTGGTAVAPGGATVNLPATKA